MLTVQNLTVSFGWKPVLDAVGFTAHDRDKIGLVGVNGAGKSTLLRALLGQINPDSGEINFSGNMDRVGWMPQVTGELGIPEDKKVFDFLLSGRPIKELEEKIAEISEALGDPARAADQSQLLHDLGEAQNAFETWGGYGAENELLQIMEGMNLDGIGLDSPISALSGGQKSKVAFARLLYSRPGIILLDEPTNHLDASTREIVAETLRDYGGTIVVVSHETDFLEKLGARRMLMLPSGEIRPYDAEVVRRYQSSAD